MNYTDEDRAIEAWAQDPEPELEGGDYDDEADDAPQLYWSEVYDRFDEMLDDCFPTVHVVGYDYDPSRALRRLDPIAYSQEFLNWCDSEDIDTDSLQGVDREGN